MTRPWLKNYPPGIPYEIEAPDHQNLVEFFDFHHQHHGNHVAFENMSATLTYAQADGLSTNFGAYLQKIGLRSNCHSIAQHSRIVLRLILCFHPQSCVMVLQCIGGISE